MALPKKTLWVLLNFLIVGLQDMSIMLRIDNGIMIKSSLVIGIVH